MYLRTHSWLPVRNRVKLQRRSPFSVAGLFDRFVHAIAMWACPVVCDDQLIDEKSYSVHATIYMA
jgi:hypothetical protein